jgi:phage tail-like protein
MADAYPLTVYSFTVNIDGKTVTGGFSECTGLTMDNDVIEYRTGIDPAHMRKLPGLRKFTNIVLKRGFVKDDTLYKWRKDVIDGKPGFRTHGSITLNGEDFKPVLQWDFYDAWPNKLEGPGLNAKNNEVAVETLEIVVERLEFKTV